MRTRPVGDVKGSHHGEIYEEMSQLDRQHDVQSQPHSASLSQVPSSGKYFFSNLELVFENEIFFFLVPTNGTPGSGADIGVRENEQTLPRSHHFSHSITQKPLSLILL
jgi:hypothetical protein